MKAGKCKLNPPENVEKFIKHRQERRGQIFSEKTVLYKLAAGSVKYLERAVCSQINKGSENDENDNLVFILLAVSDFGAAGITVTEDRKKNIDFTDTYTKACQVIVVRNK